ncbi:amidohydrolase family protein [Patescibacteria group bacterium]|nr:amidohydrolase family protein [Patescibacteria group bacterium]
MASYDIIIKNGMVFDGKENKPAKIDLGIKRGEIKVIRDLSNEKADEVIDASGKYVCPGFIDLTNHSDTHWTLFAHPHQESLVKQGVTTIIGGTCGSSLSPLINQNSLKSISKWTDISSININWQTLEEFFSELKKHKLGLNFGTLIGLNTLQYGVLSGASRNLSDDDIKEMKYLIESSMKEGAFGLSANLGSVQKEIFNDNVLESLLNSIAKKNGISKHHLEDEGSGILPSISHLISLARKTKSRLHISHFKVLGRSAWPFFEDALKIMRNAIKEKVALTGDFFPYERTGSNLFSLLPPWLRKMNEEEVMRILQIRGTQRRQDIENYLKSLTLHYDKIIIASSVFRMGAVGKTILEISKKTEVSPEEVIISLLAENNLNVSIFSEVINPGHILEIAKENYMAIASDGVGYDASSPAIPHPRSFGSFPRAFRLFVKENNILDWQTAIYKMTGLPARILGITDRGTIEKGKKADIIVFSPEEISDYSTYENSFRFSEGIEYVIINGEIVLINSGLTGKFAGQIIRKS